MLLVLPWLWTSGFSQQDRQPNLLSTGEMRKVNLRGALNLRDSDVEVIVGNRDDEYRQISGSDNSRRCG